jgi:1,4-alpha-glucan branching enzyme
MMDRKGQAMSKGKIPKVQTHFFTFRPNGEVKKVQLAGCFTNWKPIPMSRQEDGVFLVSLRLGPGTYEYKFIADGQWLVDPSHSNWAANAYGSVNSVLRIESAQ